MKFNEVVGQEYIKKALVYAVAENRIPHAILFDGPEGSGKLSLAIAFAQYLNCEDKQNGDSCGRCMSCLKYQKLIHPDLHFVFPTMKGESAKGISDEYITEWREMILESAYFTPLQWYAYIGKEKGQGTIYSEEAVEIIRKLNLKTFEAEYKCMIIWLPEKMNTVAANKLLKILEEPPQKTIFILITEEIEEIIPTFLSRCQVVKVPAIDDSSMFKALTEQYKVPEHEILNAVIMSNGNMVRANSILEDKSDTQLFLEQFISLMRLTYSRNIFELISWAEGISKISKEKQKEFLLYVLKEVRENFIITAGAGNRIMQSPDEKAFSEKFHPYINEKNIYKLVEEAEKASYHIERNGKAKIVFLDMALSMMQIIKQ